MSISERTRWELDTWMTPEAVLRAMTDFGPDRPRIWKESSHPRVYTVHDVGPTSADVTEGVTIAWSREHYDWSRPGIVTMTQIDSNVMVPGGTTAYELSALPDGTHITCTRSRTYRATFDGILAGTFMRINGSAVHRWQFARGLKRAAAIHQGQ